MENLRLNDCLINQLFESNVFDLYDVQKVKESEFSSRKIEIILDTVGRKTPEQFEQFLQKLLDNQQDHIVKKLMKTNVMGNSINGKTLFA